MASTRVRPTVVRRSSLPLTADDEEALALLRSSNYWHVLLARLGATEFASEQVSEAALLHAVFEIGLAQVREASAEAGYAELAASRAADPEDRQATARRRVPSWANEA